MMRKTYSGRRNYSRHKGGQLRATLEDMRDQTVAAIAEVSKWAALLAHDDITMLIDKACEYEGGAVTVLPAPTVQLVPVNALRDILNECLSNALTPFPAPVRKPKAMEKTLKRLVKKTAAKARKTSKKR